MTASADEVLQWHGTEDPLSIEDNRLLVSAWIAPTMAERDQCYVNRQQSIINKAWTHENAAITLTAQAITPEAFETSNNWFNAFVEQHRAELMRIRGGSTDRVSAYLLNLLPEQPTDRQLSWLFTAMDSYNHAYRSILMGWQEAQGYPDRTAEEDKALIVAANKAQNYGLHVVELADYIRQHGKNSSDRNVNKMALNSALFQAAFNLEHCRLYLNNFAASEEIKAQTTLIKKITFNDLADEIENYFIKPLPAGAKKVTGSDKGDLHEALFFTDMTFLLMTESDRYKACINFPKLRRGFDVFISNGERSIPTQLKSRVNDQEDDGRPYHPNILVLKEQNFQDKNLRNLRKRLERYRRWANNPNEPKLTADIRRSLLPTTATALERVDQTIDQPYTDYILGKVPELQLTRNQRRRVARLCGELVSKKSAQRRKH